MPESTAAIEQIQSELALVRQMLMSSGIQPNAPLNTLFNWQQPALAVNDLIDRVDRVSTALEQVPQNVPDDTVAGLQRVPPQLAYLRQAVIGNIGSNNAMYAVPPLVETLDRLLQLAEQDREDTPDWKHVEPDLLPKELLTRLRSIEGSLSNLEPRARTMAERITVIDNAYESAQRLPTDLASLAEGQKAIADYRGAAKAGSEQIAESAHRSVEKHDEIAKLAEQAQAKFDDLEKVYKAGASAGLARAFARRATSLNWSVGIWVLLLMGDLGLGGYVGAERFEALEIILQRPLPAATFWANLAFSALSLAAPVWFGWVATKQINQRFRLAEDYGFKASVATAYEGYRSEAVRLDPAMERRLFGSALTRLEEPPLRFVETEHYGTPWHELVSSPAFAKALDMVPNFREAYQKAAASVVGVVGASSELITSLKPTSDQTAKPSDEEV